MIIIAFLVIAGLISVMTFTGREEFLGGLMGLASILLGVAIFLIKIAVLIFRKKK